MSLAATLKAMRDAGCSVDQIIAVAEQVEESRKAKTREGNAERQRRLRARNACNDDNACNAVTGVTERDSVTEEPSRECIIHTRADGNRTNSSLRSELDIITPHPTDGPPADKRRQSSRPSEIVSILTECGLSDQTARELVDHRKAKRSALTVGSAKRLAKNLADFGNPEAAASEMLARGWTGFNPDWMRSSLNARAGPSPQQPAQRGGFGELAFKLREAQSERQTTENAAIADDVRLLPVIDGGPGKAGCVDDFGLSRKAFDGVG